MSPLVETLDELPERFPRVSGDEPRGRVDNGLSPAFSPRERG